MDDNHFFSIVERLRLLEGEITPTNVKHGLNAQQKSVPQMPALFKPKTQKILGGDPNAKNPMSGYMVGGSESIEHDEEMIDEEDIFEDKHLDEEASEDMLTKVKASFADYLQNLEDNMKQDRELLAKKKEDFDLKKKELKDLELQIKQKKEEQKEEHKELDEDHVQLEVGDRICVIGDNDHQGEFGNITEFSPSGKFVVVDLGYGKEISMHVSDVEFHDDQEDVEDWEDDNKRGMVPEGDTYAQGGTSTYAECVMPVVKTFTFEDGCECTIHGDEKNGFIIRRGDKQLPSKFDNLDHATMALDMFRARKAAKNQGDSADYVEEK